MEAINVLESLETLTKNIDIKKHDIIIVSHPDNFKPIDDNIIITLISKIIYNKHICRNI
jgi:hypothetical protein